MSRRPVGNQVRWSAESGVNTPVAGALAFTEIYNADIDAEVNALQEAEPTVHRILLRGNVVLGAVGIVTVGLGIVHYTNRANPTATNGGDPLNANSLFQDDWMWFDRFGLQLVTAVGIGANYRVDADIRVKRKLKEQERLILVISNAAGGVPVSFTWAVRILSKLNV